MLVEDAKIKRDRSGQTPTAEQAKETKQLQDKAKEKK